MIAYYVDVAFDNGPFEASPTWTTLANVERITIQRGRSGSLDKVEAGRCTVRINNVERLYDPMNTASPQYGNGYRLEPGKRIRVRAALDGRPEYPLFTGHVVGWYPDHPEGRAHPTLRLEAVDAFGYLNTVKVTGTLNATTCTERVIDVLDAINWPSGSSWRDTTGGINLSVMPTKVVSNVSALQLMQEAAIAERGILYVRRDGAIAFRGKRDRFLAGLTTYTFGTGGYDLLSATMAYDRTELITEARITAPGGTEQVVLGSTEGSYFRSTYSATVELADDAYASRFAYELVNRYQYPQRRISQIRTKLEFDPPGMYSNLYAVHGVDLNTRVQVVLTPAAGDPFTFAGFVEGVRHDIDGKNNHDTLTYVLSPAAYYIGWNLGVADYSELGATTILTY